METTKTTRRETNQISRCPRCKSVRADAVVVVTTTKSFQNDRMMYPLRNRSVRYEFANESGRNPRCCNDYMISRIVDGRTTEQPCGAKCMDSKGPSCECSCGGRNHGGAYSVAS